MTPSTPTWSTLLPLFERHQLASKRASGTVRLYRYRLLDLERHHPDPRAVTVADLETILASRPWAAETAKSARTAYRMFFAWAVRAGHLDHDPAAGLPSFSVPAGVPRPAPEKVIRAALLEAEPREGWMIRLATYAGLRAGEIAEVHGDWWDGRALTVPGKGGKVRRVHVRQPELVAWLDQLDGVAFPHRWTGEPLTAGTVSRLVSAALRGAPWTAHPLRHRYATTAYSVTGDLLAVQKSLGHSRPETTQRYVVVDDERLARVGEAVAA